MFEKIKSYTTYILGLMTLILGLLLSRKSKQLDTAKSELAHEKTTTEIKLNDQAREAAKQNADELVANYERLKRE